MNRTLKAIGALNVYSHLIQNKVAITNAWSLQQSRTTFVLKRRVPPYIGKKGRQPKRLKGLHHIYDFEEFTEVQPTPPLKLILTEFVDGLGTKGEVVTVGKQFGRYNLLLSNRAVYASPENLEIWEKYRKEGKDDDKPYSTAKAALVVKYLQRRMVKVEMSMDQPWTLEPWHLRVAFRRALVYLPEDALTLPEKPISGPDMENEKKVFIVGVTINKCDKVQVRCYLHHWSSDPTRAIPEDENDFRRAVEPLFPEEAELLKSFPLLPLSKEEKERRKRTEAEKVVPLWTVLSQ